MQNNFKTIIDNLPPIIGIAPNAFSRVTAGSFLNANKYSIVCFKWRGETGYIAKDMNVFAVEKEHPELKVEKTNAKEILNLKPVQNFIAKQGEPWLLIYKSTKGVQEIAERYGWNLIGNPVEVKSIYENKKVFRESLSEAGIEAITGESLLYDDLTNEKFEELLEKYGSPVVLQIAEMTEGGGTGTAFIKTIEELETFKSRILEKRDKKFIENVTAAKFISGIPTSIAACVTKHGVITGRIQTQIQDIADVRTLNEGSGLFCGHDWSYKQYNESLQQQAQEIARKFGEYLGKKGYKGIFGMDLMTNIEEGKVYPIECNPRYTDAFPVLSMMHIKNGLLPMDIYHIFENMNIDYELDINEISKNYNKPLYGSQIILETKTRSWTKVTGNIKAGVYKLGVEGKLEFVREGYGYNHIQNDNEFLLTEGVPLNGTIFKPGARVLRLVSRKAMLADTKELTSEFKNIIQKIYNEVKLVEIEPQDPSQYAD